jgi:hypothetical protein
MLHVLPAVQVLTEHPPPVHASRLQWALSPVHASTQPPMQLPMVQLAPSQGIVQPPVSAQSTLHVAPGWQLVLQLPLGVLQSTLQVVLGAQSVVHPPAGQATVQGCEGVPHASWQVPGADGSGPGLQVQLPPLHAHCAPGELGSVVQETAPEEPPVPPPCPPCEVAPPWAVVVDVPP